MVPVLDLLGSFGGLAWDMAIGPLVTIFVSHWPWFASDIVVVQGTDLAVRRAPGGWGPR